MPIHRLECQKSNLKGGRFHVLSAPVLSLIHVMSDFGLCFLKMLTICIQADWLALKDLFGVYDFMRNLAWDGDKGVTTRVAKWPFAR
jgi:hypothetical protein